jgi:hypothetical protein
MTSLLDGHSNFKNTVEESKAHKLKNRNSALNLERKYNTGIIMVAEDNHVNIEILKERLAEL